MSLHNEEWLCHSIRFDSLGVILIPWYLFGFQSYQFAVLLMTQIQWIYYHHVHAKFVSIPNAPWGDNGEHSKKIPAPAVVYVIVCSCSGWLVLVLLLLLIHQFTIHTISLWHLSKPSDKQYFVLTPMPPQTTTATMMTLWDPCCLLDVKMLLQSTDILVVNAQKKIIE